MRGRPKWALPLALVVAAGLVASVGVGAGMLFHYGIAARARPGSTIILAVLTILAIVTLALIAFALSIGPGL